MRKPPEYIADLLKPYGSAPTGEPWYKFAWADDVEETSFGQVQLRFPEHKGHWLLMKFVTWADYGPWNFEAFGPKPHLGGEYELSQVIKLDGKPVELNAIPQDILILWVICTHREKLPHFSELLNRKRAIQHERDNAWRKTFSDVYDEAQRPFADNPVSGIPDKKKPEDSRIILAEELPDKIRRQLATRAGQIKQLY
jgi:hypothetical protein